MNRRFRTRHRIATWPQPLLALGIWCLASHTLAQTPPVDVFHLPAQWVLPNGQLSPPAKSRSGLELDVDTRWADGYGYRPLRFTFESAKPVSSDFQITVRFYADDWVEHDYSLAVEQDGELHAGEKSVTLTVRAPQFDSWNFVRWEVWVDGIKEPLLSLSREHAMNFNRWQGGLTILHAVAGSNASLSTNSPHGPSPGMGMGMGGIPANRVSGPLPTDWIDYTCFDYVAMPLDDLETESRLHPERIAALRRWIHAGGNLWVEQTGLQAEQLERLSEFLQLHAPPADVKDKALDNEGLPTGWSFVAFKMPASLNEDRPDRDRQPPAAELESAEIVDDGQPEMPEFLQRLAESPRDSREWFVEHPAGFGTVTAFVNDSQSLLPGGLGRGNYDLATMRWYQRAWLPRHGLAPNAPNAEFSNLLIPGVGLAPVTEFRVLITIFVLLIGPLNYWVLSRAKRLYLLVLTVPFGAAAVTLLLFSYAFLADGLATQVRARSYTLLDQTSGEAVSWSRLSYYSGFAPADGLSFPDDTALYPILPQNPGLHPRSRQAGRVVEWQDEYQDLTLGWLPSRTPTQYLALRAHDTPSRLEVRSAPDRCQIANRLGAPVAWLVVVDEQGQLWHGAEIDYEERVELERIATKDAVRQLRESLLANKPELPPELQVATDANRPSMRRGRGRYGRYRFMSEAGEFRLHSNLLENRLEKLAATSGEVSAIGFAPRSYLALTTRAVDTPLGLDEVEEVASFHVVEGRW